MKIVKNNKLIKIFLILANFLLILFIIKECKLTEFCLTILNLISPVIFGFAISWLIKPIMLYFNKYFNIYISTSLTYIILVSSIIIIGYYLIPLVIKEIINLIPSIIKLYRMLPPRIINNINFNEISKKVLLLINNCTSNLKNIFLNIFYSCFISFYFLLSNKAVSKFISKYIPSKLINNISINLKLFVRGTILDTIILFIMSIIAFYLIKMPYSLLFAIVISITNIIPFIGPYIGGIPAVLIGLSVNIKMGIIILIIVFILQFIESSFIHPLIMSKSLKINPIIIIIGLIVFGYFMGIWGMLLSAPITSILKCIYDYYKGHHFKKVLCK
jgi:predicted PurR-regulated permease PerM